MGRIIAIASGKGGVGKTTLTANIGIALASSGYKVLLIDADIAMANLSLIFKLQNSPITLHEVLMGEASIEDATYSGPGGVDVVPSGLSIESYRQADPARLKHAIEAIKERYEFILIDVPAGIERSMLAAVSAAEQTLITTMPNSPSVADALKAKIAAQRLMSKPVGFVINMYRDEKGELSRNDISTILELPWYGTVPYDPEVRKTFTQQEKPITVRKPKSHASTAVFDIAAKIGGKKAVIQPEEKESFISKLLKKIKRKKEA